MLACPSVKIMLYRDVFGLSDISSRIYVIRVKIRYLIKALIMLDTLEAIRHYLTLPTVKVFLIN